MIDPYLQQIVDGMAASGFQLPNPFEATAMRAVMDNPMPMPPIEVGERRDIRISVPHGEVAARLYHPAPGTDLPVILFFHGGGWVVGTLDTHDRMAAALANGTGLPVLSVDYRLAPEHPFPAGLDDCVAVAQALPEIAGEHGLRPTGYAVAGDSAGGNLAAAVALRLAGTEHAPVHQLLYYPVIDADFGRLSYANAPEGGFLSLDMMRWFWDQYVSDSDERRHPHVSPIHAESHEGLAPATLVLAGYDPLHDEGLAYGEAMKRAGVEVDIHDFPGGIHGFASMFGMAPIGDEALQVGIDALKKALAPHR